MNIQYIQFIYIQFLFSEHDCIEKITSASAMIRNKIFPLNRLEIYFVYYNDC